MDLLPNPLTDEQTQSQPTFDPNCPAIRAIAKFRLWFACGIGIVAASFILGGILVRSEIENITLRLEKKIVSVVREELGAQKKYTYAPEVRRPFFQVIPSANAANNQQPEGTQ